MTPRLLLDTHALLWALSASSRLPARVASAIRPADTDVYASSVTTWELAIKVTLGKIDTAFPSGLVAKYAIEHWTRLPVEIEIASEFRYGDPVLGPDTLTLAVSQSGETIDTLEAARHAKRQGSRVLAVTNTVGSSLAREADGVLYTHAGPEIGVAATKTFSTQMVAQHLTALYLAQIRSTMFPEEIASIVRLMHRLPEAVERALALGPQVEELAAAYAGASDFLFISRRPG